MRMPTVIRIEFRGWMRGFFLLCLEDRLLLILGMILRLVLFIFVETFFVLTLLWLWPSLFWFNFTFLCFFFFLFFLVCRTWCSQDFQLCMFFPLSFIYVQNWWKFMHWDHGLDVTKVEMFRSHGFGLISLSSKIMDLWMLFQLQIWSFRKVEH